MTLLETINDYTSKLPDKEITDFHGELVSNAAHDERSYGPSTTSELILSDDIPTINNPKELYVALIGKTETLEDEEIAKEVIDGVFHYIYYVLQEYFVHELSDNLQTTEDIKEEDLPF